MGPEPSLATESAHFYLSNIMAEPFFEIPELLYWLCFFIGTALLFTPFFWLHSLLPNNKGSESLLYFTGASIMRSIFVLIVFSIIRLCLAGAAVQSLLTELVLLFCFVSYFSLIKAVQKSDFKSAVCIYMDEVKSILWLILIVLIFWVIVFSLFKMTLWLNALGVMLPIPVMVFCSALSIFILLYFYYRQVEISLREIREIPLKYHDLFLPILAGLTIGVSPLWLYNLSVDPEAYERFNPPPKLRII